MLFLFIHLFIGVLLTIRALKIDRGILSKKHSALAIIFFIFLWPIFLVLAHMVDNKNRGTK